MRTAITAIAIALIASIAYAQDVTISLTGTDLKYFQDRAKERGLTVKEYIEERILGESQSYRVWDAENELRNISLKDKEEFIKTQRGR